MPPWHLTCPRRSRPCKQASAQLKKPADQLTSGLFAVEGNLRLQPLLHHQALRELAAVHQVRPSGQAAQVQFRIEAGRGGVVAHHTAQRVGEDEGLTGRANGQAQSSRTVGGVGEKDGGVWRWLLP